MRVGFTGAQGTGKTTLLRAVEKSDLGFTVVPSTARAALAAGYAVNRDATRESQLVTTVSRVALEDNLYRTTHKTLSDRTPIDSLAYTVYQMMHVWQPKMDTMDFYYQITEQLVFEHMYKYDAVIYFPVWWKPKADGVRDDDPFYQQTIDGIILALLNKAGIEVATVPMGTTDKRLLWLTRTLNL